MPGNDNQLKAYKNSDTEDDYLSLIVKVAYGQTSGLQLVLLFCLLMLWPVELRLIKPWMLYLYFTCTWLVMTHRKILPIALNANMVLRFCNFLIRSLV